MLPACQVFPADRVGRERGQLLHLHSSLVPVQVDVQAGAEPETLLLTNLGQPEGALAQALRVRPLRHEDDAPGVGPETIYKVPRFADIRWRLDDKLKLIIIPRDQLGEYGCLYPCAFMLWGPRATGGGIR